ncbi:MoaD/ThiS family protein [Sphingopyxis sp. PET50]|uniref:MoaD/ThiS family protein n=1 Tax=Sphingopyxis sp. PET50 TaxID=2976533 RepID=UPI0021AF40CD|nr:MoaD/ThiS family protein [Sphingopyxis sp. PET50]
MALTLSYFAWVRERMGIADETVTPPAGVATIGDLIGWLAERDEPGTWAFSEPAQIRAAIDGRMAGAGALLPARGEIALFPPVTGG